MDFLKGIIDLFLHLDVHLHDVIAQYGLWTYLLLFLIVFCETGLVVTPILPGDSLLFAAGTFAGAGDLNPLLLFVLLTAAAVVGDAVNYAFGRILGTKVFTRSSGFFFRKDHLLKTQAFYETHGKVTIILARFLPIIRTFAPFVAGIGKMSYPIFFLYNVVGALLWVGLFVAGGYFFGSIPVVRENFEFVILGIIAVSILPLIIGIVRGKK